MCGGTQCNCEPLFTSHGDPGPVTFVAELAGKDVDLSALGSWAEVFSLGEQQRVAFARLLRMQPIIAFLDEATSALDVDTEGEMYALLKSTCKGFVSVGHRPQLAAFHTHILRWQSPGVWNLSHVDHL
jgi:vitamin B12/bleomycin/antimicrobial peptide transport system ATP-binding/permease protein